MHRVIHIFILSLAVTMPLQAQELNARISVNSERIQGTNRNIFTTMERALNQFINGTKWSATPFSTNERIDCSFSVVILEQPSDNTFRAELLIQSSRPVYNSSYITTLCNYRDTKFDFEYMENATIQMQQNTLNNNLEAVIAFYANLILALDFDSFSPMGGSVFFRQAQQIATMAQSAGWNGWSAFDDSKSRGSMITAYLDESLKSYRELWYTYHRKGLDEMAANPDRARMTVLSVAPAMKEMRQARFSEILLQMFADAKLDELVAIAGKATADEKKELYDLLRGIYPTLSTQLEPLKK
ncbi:MAG: DUF4835 family protein [Dysgonamonadaceae bacterium]|jgi:hypothetical protein|nr:DUF4835 family protein [Dysgonamonadaceae bacterium]